MLGGVYAFDWDFIPPNAFFHVMVFLIAQTWKRSPVSMKGPRQYVSTG